MSDVLGSACFAPHSVSGIQVARLLEKPDDPFASPTLSLEGVDYRGSEAGAALRRLDTATSLSVTGAQGWILEVGGMNGGLATQVLVKAPNPLGARSLIDQLVEWPGFTAAYLGDDTDAYIQSERSPAALDRAGLSQEGLSKVPGGVFPWEHEAVDVSGNPGRREPWNGLWLWASATIWFGPGALAFFPRKRLLSFDQADAVWETKSCVVVELFPFEFYDASPGGLRERQRALRAWLDWDELPSASGRETGQVVDPQVEIESHPVSGVSRRVTVWLDDSRNARAPRSRARWMRVVEMDREGRILRDAVVRAGRSAAD